MSHSINGVSLRLFYQVFTAPTMLLWSWLDLNCPQCAMFQTGAALFQEHSAITSWQKDRDVPNQKPGMLAGPLHSGLLS